MYRIHGYVESAVQTLSHKNGYNRLETFDFNTRKHIQTFRKLALTKFYVLQVMP